MNFVTSVDVTIPSEADFIKVVEEEVDDCNGKYEIKKLKTKTGKDVINLILEDDNKISNNLLCFINNGKVEIKSVMFGSKSFLNGDYPSSEPTDLTCDILKSLTNHYSGSCAMYHNGQAFLSIDGRGHSAVLAVVDKKTMGAIANAGSADMDITFGIKEYLESRPTFYASLKTMPKPDNMNAIIDCVLKERLDKKVSVKEFHDVLYQAVILGATHPTGCQIVELLKEESDDDN